MQGDFQYLGYVKVTGQYVSFFSESAYFYTTAASTFAGIFRCLSLSHQFHDISIGVEYGRIAVTFADYFATFDFSPFFKK